jgi:hypothetical protein
MQAKSLTEGRPFEFVEANRFTIEYSSYPIGPVAYPWGFPILLAPLYTLFGLNMIALKAVGVVCFLVFLFVLWRGFRHDHSDVWRVVLLGLFALNPTMQRAMNNILSDIPFLLVSTCSVLLIGRLVIDRRRLLSSVCDQVLLGTAIAAAVFIRTNGILLLVTLGIAQCLALIRRGYGHAVAQKPGSAGFRRFLPTPHVAVRHVGLHLLPYVSFVSVVSMGQALLPDGGLSQGGMMGGVSMEGIQHHLHYYLDLPAAFFAGVPHHHLIYGASIPLAIAGVMTRYRSAHHMLVYITLTFLLYILWPPTQGLRFLFPILPFYLSFVLSGLEHYAGSMVKPERGLPTVIVMLPIVLLLVYFGKQSVNNAFTNLVRNRASFSGPFAETSRSMFAYIEENTEAESIVVFFKPRAMRMMTGRRSLMINQVGEISRGDYVCLYRPEAVSLQHPLNIDQILPDAVRCLTEQGTLQSIYTNRDFVVYRLTESPTTALHTDGRCAALQPRQ